MHIDAVDKDGLSQVNGGASSEHNQHGVFGDSVEGRELFQQHGKADLPQQREKYDKNQPEILGSLLPPSTYAGEANHLAERITRCQTNFRQSTRALSIQENYQAHVLNAVLNCVKEWRAILRRFASTWDSAAEELTHAKALARNLFNLIQQALQCGPLKGSKAGYWKRCGSGVAVAGFSFLHSVAPTPEVANALLFTDKQVHTLQKWKDDARKAAECGKLPSNFVLTMNCEAEHFKAEKRILREKKKERRLCAAVMRVHKGM